jgi:hypothetical protein
MATFGFGSGSSSGNRIRKDRSKTRKIKQLRRSMLEALEVRNLMTTGLELIGIQPNEGSVLALGATSNPTVLNVSPRELVLRFGDGAAIDPKTLNGIQIKRAGVDGALSSAYITTDLGTNAAAVIDFSASLPGQQGNGTEIRFTQTARSTGVIGKPISYPIITVQGQRINIDVNIQQGFQTTAGDLVRAMEEDAAAKKLVVTSLLRGSSFATIADTVPIGRSLILIGADSSRASTNFNSGNASLQAEFVSVNSGNTSSGVRVEFTSRSFDTPAPPNVIVAGQTIFVELNSNPRSLTTVQEVLDAINGSAEASALVVGRLVSGSALTRIGGNATTYSPLILAGGDDQLVTPAYIGLGDTGREVIVRFGETLPDDLYVIDIFGNGQFALRDVEGEAFNGGVSRSVRFDLDLGPTVQAVVPQPVDNRNGVRKPQREFIYVYFNGDKLLASEATKPIYYQLIYTGNTVNSGDDIVFRPVVVTYNASLNRVDLKFDRNIDELVNPSAPGAGVLSPGALRLRIGNDEGPVNTSVTSFNLLPTTDAGDQFKTALDLGGGWLVGGGAKAAIVSSEIKNKTPYVLDFPGANDEASNRNNRYQQHITRVDGDGIEVVYYNFATALGTSNQSVQLNVITETQKVMVRQVISLYERYFGVRFVESDNQGFTVAVGDMQAIDPETALTPLESNRPGGLTYAAGPLLSNASQSAVIIDSQDFNTASDNLFGTELFRSFMRGIGVLLGLGNADELPQSTIQNNSPITDPNVENVFPGNADIIHGQYLFRPESRDIDLYKFTLPDGGGKLSLQVLAERQSDSSLLDAALRLYRREAAGWVEMAANDDYFSKDPRIDLEFVSAGEYAIGVSAKGNNSYDPSIADSGLGGRSEGKYQLRIDFRPPAASTLVDANGAPTPLDGDGDGRPGGVFNYWFVPTREISDFSASATGVITLWVDKTAPARPVNDPSLGLFSTPFNTIGAALSRANALAQQFTDPQTKEGKRIVTVRILGNSQNRAYELGFNRFGQAMADGASFDVPRNVNVMIDAGAIIKMGRSRISVGSSTVSVDRSGGSLQLLGTPDTKVILTSLNDTVGVGLNPDKTPPAAAAGDWGGIDFRNRIDGSDETRIDKERQGLFLNAVVHSDVRFGGGQVLVDSVSQVITPIHIVDSRPTIANNLVTRSADAAMSATPNSFREDDYRDPKSQASGLFVPDYERIGPDIRGNRVVNNTINGLFVKTRTGAAETLETITVAARFNEVDIPYVLAENLVVAGTPGGGILDVSSPPSTIVVLNGSAGGSLPAGTYNYRIVYVDSNGNESLASLPTDSVTVAENSKIAISNLPPIGGSLPYVGRRIYRSSLAGVAPYRLVGQVNASTTSYVDDGSVTGIELVDLPAKIRPRLDGSLMIDPGAVIKNRGSRIEVMNGGVLMAEGTASRPIIMTSINDNRYGAGGTFDTAGNSGTKLSQPGDWGGIFVGHGSTGSLDQARLSFAGGINRIEGGFAPFNPIEVHQADFRMANSTVEQSKSGTDSSVADPKRAGRGTNAEAVVFVRGAQPILVSNRFRDNDGAAINIDVNSLTNQFINDRGRSTGSLQRAGDYLENQGPLIRDNLLSNNKLNGLEVRGQDLTTESVWDDTDIVHVVFDDIRSPDFHTYGGLRLKSNDRQSLVVKFLNQSNEFAGLTASGRGQDIADRIGGSVQLVGQPGAPVILTSINDCSIGAGFTVEGFSQVDTLNTGFCLAAGKVPYADVLVVMDESGSMGFAQEFSVGMIADLDNALIRAGVGSTSVGGNLFGLVGYGDSNDVPRSIPVSPSGSLWGTSSDYATAAGTLRVDGVLEDGFLAIDYALSNYEFRPNAERFVILVTNEDRDELDSSKTYATTLARLEQNNIKLQGIVDANFLDANRRQALALDPELNAYSADGQGGFTKSPGGSIESAFGTTQQDYINMVFARKGIVGDINQIQEGGVTATSFSQVLVTSIVQQTGAQPASAGDWGGVRMDTFSNDRNFAVVSELESPRAMANSLNETPATSQYLGQLARSVSSGDENARLGFQVQGVIGRPSDVDVYSFTAFGGTEVWLDIDRTEASLDTVVELISADGRILALSDNSYSEENGGSTLYSTFDDNSVNPLRKSPLAKVAQTSRGEARDDYGTNVKDAGFRVKLPGLSNQATLYHVRVRSSNQILGQPPVSPALTSPDSVGKGLSRGAYQLQVRLGEAQEHPGSYVGYADIRYATTGLSLSGVPRHSPLVGETGEIAGDLATAPNNTSGPNNTFLTAQELGNLLQTDRRAISVAGNLSSANDIDWFTFTIDYNSLVTPLREYLSTIFDIDYADGVGRADMSMYLFSANGTLVRMGENSNILDDRHAAVAGAGNSDLTRGSTGALDPFIGPAELPAGRYYLALTNRTQVPTVLANRLNNSIGNSNVRVLPVSSSRLLVEDRVGASDARLSTVPPVYSQFLNLASRVEYTLGDVPLYFSQSSSVSGQTNTFLGNPFTGQIGNRVGAAAFEMRDTFIRPNGDFRGFATDNNPNLETKRYILIDPATGGGGVDGVGFNFGVRGLNPGGTLGGSNAPMTIESATVMPIDGEEFGFVVANRNSGPGFVNNSGFQYSRNIVYRFDPNTGEGISRPGVVNQFNIEGVTPNSILGAGTAITERGFIDTNSQQGITPKQLALTEATKSVNGVAQSLINDGDSFTVVATVGGRQITTVYEFNSGPELFLNLTPNAASPQTLEQGDRFQIDGVTYQIETGNTPVATPGVRTVFYNKLMNNEQFALAVRQAVPASIQVGFDGNRLHFSGATNGVFTTLVDVRRVATQTTATGAVPSGRVAINFLAQDTAETIAARVTQAINAQGLAGISALQVGLRSNEVVLQGPATITGSSTSTGGIISVGQLAPNGTITGIAGVGGDLYAISNVGGLYRVSRAQLQTNTAGAIGSYINSSYELRGIAFTGLVRGPTNVAGGVYSNILFGTTGSGRVYAFDTNGVLQPVFANGSTFVDTGIGGLDGIAFSNLDFNLWHATERRGTNAGHGINADIEGNSQTDGRTSWYFGFEGPTAHGNADLRGVLNPLAQPRALGQPLQNSYNFPGGALGVLESQPISLAGISAADLPTLYFNYFLSSDQGSTTTPRSESFRVYASGENGNWTLLDTNFVPNATAPIPNGTVPAPTVNNPSVAWRQARVSLAGLAGNREVRFRFEFSTAGGLSYGSFGGRGSELRTVSGSQLRDGQIFTVNGQLFELEMGTTLVFPSGAGIGNGETLTVGGVTFVFWNGTGAKPAGNVIPFSNSDSPSDVANAALAAIGAVQFPFDEITVNLNPEPVSRNETLGSATVLSGATIQKQTRFTVNGAIGDIPDEPNPRDVDLLRVSLQAGTTLNIQVSALNVGSTPLNPLVRLFDARGNELGRASIPTSGPGSKDASAVLIETVSVAGEYFIGVSNTSINNYNPNIEEGRTALGAVGLTGLYQIKMDVIPRSAIVTQTIDLKLSPEAAIRNETFETAIPVNNAAGLRTRVSGNGRIGDIALAPGENPENVRRDVDMLRVKIESGATLNVRVSVPEIPAPIDPLKPHNPLIRIFDSRGVEIRRSSLLVNGPGADDQYVELRETFVAAGDYYIGISNKEINNYDPTNENGRGSTGPTFDYRLAMEIIPKSAILTVDNRLPLFDLTPVTLSAGSRIRVEGTTGVGYEVQQISVTGNPTGGTFRLQLNAAGSTAITAAIPWNATAAQLQKALEDLPNVNVGDVAVLGGPLPGSPLTVTFQGALANANIAEMLDEDAGMIGGGISVTTIKDRDLGTVPVQILPNMTSSEVAAAVARAIESSLSNSFDQFPTIARRGDVLDMTGYSVQSSGPFYLTGARAGDENWRSDLRSQNNAFEGLFLDDFLIGLAERGESVTGATADTTFTQVASPGSEILVGSYQLEIRGGSDYGSPTRTGINLTRAFDPNQVLSDSVEIRFNDASKISDGSTITIDDGVNSITFEFDDASLPANSPGRGVRPGNLAISFDPIANESALVIAERFRNAVNSTVVQSVLNVGALTSDGSSAGRTSVDVSLVGSVTVTIDPKIGFILDRSPNIRFKDSSSLRDGDTIRIDDGMNTVTLEFDDRAILAGSPAFGVRTENIAIPFNSTLPETSLAIANRVLSIINSPEVQSRVRIAAYPVTGLAGQASDAITVSGAIGVFTSSNVGAIISQLLEGDRNIVRDQGQIIIENSRISDSSDFGISLAADVRDSVSRAPNPGAVRNLVTINDQRLIPGAVVMNNELIANRNGGIRISGESGTAANLPAAPVPFARVVNNTVLGGRISSVTLPPSATFAGSFYKLGTLAFADSVVSYDPRVGGGPIPLTGLQDPSRALGAPNYSSVGEPRPNQGVVSLGRGGVLVLRFDNNILTGSGDSSPDLAVYEVGNAELVRVEVSSDGVTYTSVGSASFNSPLIDLDQYGFNALSQLYFVRLTDEPNEGGISGDSVGADIDAVGALSSRGGYRFTPGGTGIRVENSASPTLLNNILVNSVEGISVSANSSTTVIGGTLYQGNSNNVVGAGVGQFAIQSSINIPLFTNLGTQNLYPVPGAPSIDSSIDSLLDRSALLTVKQPLGLAPSPIIAPALDIYGALRVDDPTVVAPPGLGESIFKERGAADRSDFFGPVAVSINPLDNDAAGLDSNPVSGTIELVSSSLQAIDIQLLDASALNNLTQGSDIDPATVLSRAITVSKNGKTLLEGRDYRFGYNSTSKIIRLTSLSGLWESGAFYTIRFIVGQEQLIQAVAPSQMLDGTVYTILDANKTPKYFEIETGLRLEIPTSFDGVTHNIIDGSLFSIDDGAKRVQFEFDNNNLSTTGVRVIPFNTQDLPSVLIGKIADAIRAEGLNLTVQPFGTKSLQILSQAPVQFIPATSKISSFGRTGTTPTYGLQIQSVAGVPQGIFDGQTFSIQRGGLTATFEFDGNATIAIENIRVGLDTASMSNQAILIANAINGSGLGVVATVGANGYISVGADPSIRITAGTSALAVVGVPGRSATIPITIDLATITTAVQVAEKIQSVLAAANMVGVDPQQFSTSVLLKGATGATGNGVVTIEGIRDRAGNSMRATELNGESLINIFVGDGFDFGDAPDPLYPSLNDSNGPRHKVVRGFSLGPSVNTDPDARLIDQDTDDGVVIDPLIKGFTSSVKVNVQGIDLSPEVNRPGYVSLWIDFDGDGVFESDSASGEKFTVTGRVVNGENTINVKVPGTAVVGKPLAARIRLSSDKNAVDVPVGEAKDGEVEDYLVTIGQNPYTNPTNPFDVTGDGFVSPIDVLQVVNFINGSGAPTVPLTLPRDPLLGYLDVNGNGFVDPMDVLAVINFINRQISGGSGEGEGSSDSSNLWISAASVSPTPTSNSSKLDRADESVYRPSADFGAEMSLDMFLASLGRQEMDPLPADDSIELISSATAQQRREENESEWATALEDVLHELL